MKGAQPAQPRVPVASHQFAISGGAIGSMREKHLTQKALRAK